MKPAIDLEKEQAIEKALRTISSGYQKSYSLSSILRSDAGWTNPCDPKFITLLKLPRVVEYTYRGESITYASYKVFRTTSLWFLVVACSGYLHPHQIPRNAIINLPSVQSILTAIQAKVESNVGKTIII